MASFRRHAGTTHEPENRWPHGWWILPAAIFGSFMWVWIIRRLVETFWGLK
jgi:hypothetical protein